MTDGAAEQAEGRTLGAVTDAASSSSSSETGGCPVAWCPICLTVSSARPLAPDVIEHLLKAGNELFMAFRAVIDDRADGFGGPEEQPKGPTRLEKIELG